MNRDRLGRWINGKLEAFDDKGKKITHTDRHPAWMPIERAEDKRRRLRLEAAKKTKVDSSTSARRYPGRS